MLKIIIFYPLPFSVLLMMGRQAVTRGSRYEGMNNEKLSWEFVDVQIWGMTEDTGGC